MIDCYLYELISSNLDKMENIKTAQIIKAFFVSSPSDGNLLHLLQKAQKAEHKAWLLKFDM